MAERSGDELEKTLLGLSIIEPPKLENAGLEDCALPPHSIMEAFSRATAASKPRATDDGNYEDEEESTANIGGGVNVAMFNDDDDDEGGEKHCCCPKDSDVVNDD